VRRVGELVTANPIDRIARPKFERTYRALGIQPIFIEVSQASELETAIDEMARRGAQMALVSPEPILYANFAPILRAAQRNKLPLMVEERIPLEAGALISYAPDEAELDRQLAFVADKLLRGARGGGVI